MFQNLLLDILSNSAICFVAVLVWDWAWTIWAQRRNRNQQCARCRCDITTIDTVEIRHGFRDSFELKYCEPCAAIVNERRHAVEIVIWIVFAMLAMGLTVLVDAPKIVTIPVTLVVLRVAWWMMRD